MFDEDSRHVRPRTPITADQVVELAREIHSAAHSGTWDLTDFSACLIAAAVLLTSGK